ncbi:RHS repeat-associated core domain-containing protein [Kitasatospora mediocidica]|uniref:RHS repeat-associated core domain-containing protein n=1 Tax=Kitasatospora mediocidica TaxID=58352 RepID=UPI00068BCC5B|nr:RHS repeat-associated core domain-containing protein [Kitasatospora mediocidica]
MSNQIVKALEDGAKKLGKALAEDAGKTVKDFYHSASSKLKTVAKRTAETDAEHEAALKKILDDGKHDEPHGPHLAGGARGRGEGEQPLGRGGRSGQAVDGNGGCKTAGDPVDVVSGQVLTTEIDLVLAGLLPVILRRSYASGYIGGRLHGQGWSSTLDQRIEIDADGIHFAGDDAQILHYPHPGQPGLAVLPSAGARWPLTWDQHSGDFRIEDPDRGWTRHFTGAGAGAGAGAYRIGETRSISALSDRNDHRITFQRDDRGLPTEVAHTGGYRVAVDTVVTPQGPRVEQLRIPGSDDITVVAYQYYPDGRLAGVVNSSGLPYVYEYDDAGRMTAWIDRNGQSYEYAYDDQGRAVTGTGQNRFLNASFRYDTDRRVTTSTDSLGHTTEYHWDAHHRVTQIVDPLGCSTTTSYDAQGRITARTDEIGRTTRFDLDENGDLARITEPDGSTTTLTYTALRQLASVTQAGVLTSAFTYDETGNLLTATDAAGATTVKQYDGQGRPVSVTDPLGHTQRIETNPAGLITTVTDALGRTVHATYDAFGRIASSTDVLGATTRVVRRIEGEVTERIHPDGTRETWTHDPEGNVTQTCDQAGAITQFRIGPFGQPASRVLPDGEEQHFEYDTELQLLAVTTNGLVWRYRYDEAGHLVGESDFNGRTLTYRLDGADQLLQTIDSAGRTTAFDYNQAGQITERRNHDGSTTRLGYDDRGRLTAITNSAGSTLRYTHDATGHVLSESVDGRTTTYTYDLLGRRTARTTPTGLTSTWTWNATGQPAALTSPLASLSFAHDQSGRETTCYIGTGAALTQTWDACDRLSAQSIWARGHARDPDTFTNTQERTYTYRSDGMPQTVTDRLRGRRDFTLTPAGRVTRVSAQTWSETYAYDPLGNITHAQDTRRPDSATAGERTHTGSLLHTAGRTSYAYDDQQRLVRRVTRTLSGQRHEWRYTWNAEDQLTRVDTPSRGSWAYTYDPLGRRTSKRRLDQAGGEGADETTFFTWDGVQLTEQYTAGAGGTGHTLTWDWEPGTWRPVGQSERSWHSTAEVDRRFFAIVTDLVDAPSELVTDDGHIVWAADADLWGRELRRPDAQAGTPTCPLGRPGQYHDDESGLQYNYFRYYDPATGRYLSCDPYGLDAGPNPHSYVPNPLFWIDPLGLAPKRQPVGWGGSHYSLRPSNWTDGSDNNSYERNHMPARDAYLKIAGAKLGYGAGPAIRMDYDDHRKFISTGSGDESIAWRAKQRSLIRQGKFDVAMKMDIGMIRKAHGTKYDAAIKEMTDHMKVNKPFQKYLSDHGWKIRYCLLE